MRMSKVFKNKFKVGDILRGHDNKKKMWLVVNLFEFDNTFCYKAWCLTPKYSVLQGTQVFSQLYLEELYDKFD